MRNLKTVLAALAIAVAAAAAARAEPLLIRNSYVVPVANWEPMIVEKKDLAKHWGRSYVMEAVRYQGTPTMITALANGELEIANLAYSTFPLAVQNANLDDLRIIADEFQDGVSGYHSNEFYVLKDSPIQKVRGDRSAAGLLTAISGAAEISRDGPLIADGDKSATSYRGSVRSARPYSSRSVLPVRKNRSCQAGSRKRAARIGSGRLSPSSTMSSNSRPRCP